MRSLRGTIKQNVSCLHHGRCFGLPNTTYKHRPALGHGTITRRWLSLQPLDTNSYAASHPPSDEQRREAARFFTTLPPNLLFSSSTFRTLPASNHPEVTFLGRSNVGKSSLINALFNRHNMAQTSRKPGKTRLMHAYGVSPHPLSAAKQSATKSELMQNAWKRLRGGILLVDMPGYGHKSRQNWGDEIAKYLRQRKQLRRVFILIDSEHGLKNTDKAMMEHLLQDGIPYSLVYSKIDKLFDSGGRNMTTVMLANRIAKVRDAVEALKATVSAELLGGRSMAGDVLCVSSRTAIDDGSGQPEKIGMGALRYAVMSACGLVSESGLSKGMNVADIQILDDLPVIVDTQSKADAPSS